MSQFIHFVSGSRRSQYIYIEKTEKDTQTLKCYLS